MPTSTTPSSSDFAGFIDGFQARNLASIQRNIALQLSEMQTRLTVIKDRIRDHQAQLGPLTPIVSALDTAFHDQSGTIVDRLVEVGKYLTELLMKNGSLIKTDEAIHGQVKGFVRAYLEAAEVSRYEKAIDAAVGVGEAYREMGLVVA